MPDRGREQRTLQRAWKEFGANSQFKEGFAASNTKHGKTVDRIVTLPLAMDATTKCGVTASTSPRAFDFRICSVLPGKPDAFHDRGRHRAVPIYQRHVLDSVGWWLTENKDSDGNDQLFCLLVGASVEAIQKSIASFHQDRGWRRYGSTTQHGSNYE